MSEADELPEAHEDKLAYLERAAQHGEALRTLLELGAHAEPIHAYVAANPDLVAEPAAAGFTVRYGSLVRWDVSLDEDDRVEGYGASGYQPLMSALGLDFSGRPYFAGNG